VRTDSDVAGTLDATSAFVRRYVVLTEHQLVAVALWVFHTHAIEAAESTPYLSVTSAVPRSGKSRLLEVFELLVRPAASDREHQRRGAVQGDRQADPEPVV
jgi:hypothetical protein